MRPPRTLGPMVVEFIGIPGSGKTTLCTAIVSDLRRDGFIVITEHDYFRWMKRPLHKKVGSVITDGMPTWHFALRLYWFLYHCTLLRGRALLGMGFHLTCMRAWLSQIVSSKEPALVSVLDGFAWFRLTNRLKLRPPLWTSARRSSSSAQSSFSYRRCDMRWIFKTIPVEVAVQRISRRMLRDRAPKGIETASPERRQVVLSRQTQLYQLVCDAIRISVRRQRVSGRWRRTYSGASPSNQGAIIQSLQEDTFAATMYDVTPSTRPRGHGRICEY